MAHRSWLKSLFAPAIRFSQRLFKPVLKFFAPLSRPVSHSDSTTEQVSPATADSLQGDNSRVLNLWVDVLEASVNKPASILQLEAECGYTAPLHIWRQIIDAWYGQIHHLPKPA